MGEQLMSVSLIAASFPHMVLNAHDVPKPDYRMYNSWKVAAGETVKHMVEWIKVVAQNCPGGKLATLILNCHGAPGKICAGQGILQSDLAEFGNMYGLANEIWVVACEVGQEGFGSDFCGCLAMAANSTVVAAERKQRTGVVDQDLSFPYGTIDDWEGEVFKYDKINGSRLPYSPTYYKG